MGDLELCGMSQLGAVLVAQGRIEQGVALLDEAMAGCLGGEPGSFDTVAFTGCTTMVACARCADRARRGRLLALRHLGGAMGRVAESATAYGNRHAELNLSLDASWEDPSRSREVIAWTREAWQALKDLTGGDAYLNFAGLGEDNDALARGAYRENYPRLREIKRRYDPANLFRSNVNVAP
jgi:hypothetical protein